MPVISTFVLFMGAGYIIGGLRSCLIVGSLILFIALSEYWDRTLITLYMATFAVGVSAISGIIVGSLCSQTIDNNAHTESLNVGVVKVFNGSTELTQALSGTNTEDMCVFMIIKYQHLMNGVMEM